MRRILNILAQFLNIRFTYMYVAPDWVDSNDVYRCNTRRTGPCTLPISSYRYVSGYVSGYVSDISGCRRLLYSMLQNNTPAL